MSPGTQKQTPQNIFSDTETFQTPAALFHDSLHELDQPGEPSKGALDISWTQCNVTEMLLGLDPRTDSDPARYGHHVVVRSVRIQCSLPPAAPHTVAEPQLHSTRWSRPTPVNKKHLWACSQFWSFSGESQKNILGTGELRAWQQYGNTIWQISMWRQSTRHMSLWFANAPRIKVFLLLFAPISWSHHCFLTPPLGTQTSTLPQTTAKPHSPWRLSGQTDPAQSAALWAVTEPSPASREQTHCGSPTGAPMSLSGHRHDNIRKMEAAQSVRDITHRAFAKRLWSETYANRKTSNRTFGSRLADQTRPQASKMLLVKTNWALDKGFHVKSVSFGSFKKSNCPSTPLIKIGFLSKTFQDLPSKMLQGNYTKTVSSTKDNINIYVCVFY